MRGCNNSDVYNHNNPKPGYDDISQNKYNRYERVR